MPFDGNAPSTLKSSDVLAITHKRAFKVYTEPAPRPKTPPRTIAKAERAILLLEIVDELFGGGENWLQFGYQNGKGRYCLVRALEHVQGGRIRSDDDASLYMNRAIAASVGRRMPIIAFNDTRRSYAEIRAVICLAREMAQRVVDGHAGRLQPALPAPF